MFEDAYTIEIQIQKAARHTRAFPLRIGFREMANSEIGDGLTESR